MIINLYNKIVFYINDSTVPPTISPSYPCDYFIGMFPDLGTEDTPHYFKNLMKNYNSQNIVLDNSSGFPLDTTNGMQFSSGNSQSMTSITVTAQRAIGVQFWFKGSFISGNQIAALCKSSSSKSVYFDRNGNDLRLMTTYSGLSYTFTGAATSLSSTGWIFFGMSAGWMARNNDFMLCGYIYQASSGYEQGICVQSVSISASDFGSGSTLYVQFGTGLNGYLNDVYVVNHLEHFETFKLFKSSFGTDRYHCFDSNYNMDPHYISNGCGNGYMLPTESSETCDDQNTTGGDGCSSTCTRENLYKCTSTGIAGISSCQFVCRNGIYEPTYGEFCDDGNNVALDGCTSQCAIENGWDCSASVAGSKSVCVPICGDNYRVAGEGCDDGNKNDNMGCKSDCSGAMNGWHCSGGSATTKDTCTEQCGDGFITTHEQCEDSNTISLDGCSSTCQDEPGWTCTNNVAMTSTTCVPICGDNYRVKGEACDDGNDTDNQGCKNDCSGMINGWHCSGGSATSKDTCVEQCNDGYITINEQCEDGNLSNGDGCSNHY